MYMAKLVAEEGNLRGLVLPLEEGKEWVIGRDPDTCQLLIEDPVASRKHLVCRETKDGIVIENLSLTNPIEVNQEVVKEPRLLKDGDAVKIGSSIYRFFVDTDASFVTEIKEGKEGQDTATMVKPEEQAMSHTDKTGQELDLEQGLTANEPPLLLAKEFNVEEVGVFKPEAVMVQGLSCGEVGYITCNVHEPQEIRFGDTITEAAQAAAQPLEGYRQLSPLVFCGVYPVNPGDFMALREAIAKLKLNDPSFAYEPETSQSFGHGFRCGFLGLLHMEIVQERLQREFDLNLILTTPNVCYRVFRRDNSLLEIENPFQLPDASEITKIEEPFVEVAILTPVSAMDAVMELAKRKRGIYIRSEYVSDRMRIIFEIPLSEVIVDFNDLVKSATRGYGSIDYKFKEYKAAQISKLDILINDKICDAFSCLVNKERAYDKGLALVSKLKDIIPQQLFEVRIQAACDGRIISSARIKSAGKNVTAKCYGGDITRKRKLWEKQKEGKKKLKQIGQVEVPQEAFLAALKL